MKFRKLFTVLLSLLMALLMIGCGSGDAQQADSTASQISDENVNVTETDTEANAETEADEEIIAETAENFSAIAYAPIDKGLDLTDSVLDGRVAIDGVVYQMPIAVSELTDNGWVVEHAEETLESGQFIVHTTFSKDNMKFGASVVNCTSENITVSNGHVARMWLGTTSYACNDASELIVAQFTKEIGMSTSVDELKAIMGEPYSENIDNESNTVIIQYKGEGGTINIDIGFLARYENGQAVEIELSYLPQDFQP